MMTTESIPSSSAPIEDDFIPNKTAWKSIYLCGIFAVIQSSQFSIFFSSLWPYLKSLDPKFSESTLGHVIASYSTAQLLSAPIFGYWSNKINQVKLPLTTGFALMALGNLFHFCAQCVPVNLLTVIMILARFTTGAGSGNSALLRTHVAAASTFHDRSRAMSVVQGGMAVGILLGPLIQLLFAPLHEEGFKIGPVTFDIYTTPAAFLVFLNILGALMVIALFRDAPFTRKEDIKEKEDSSCSIGLFVCVATSFTHIFTLTIIETIASPYTMMMFGFTKEQAITRNSIAHGTAGIVSAIIYVALIVFNTSRLLPERLTAIICQLVMASMFVATFSYPREVLTGISSNVTVPNCDTSRFTWCDSLTPTSLWLFYGFYVLVIGVAFSFMTIVVTTLFSKIIGDKKQGTLQGVYQMAGSVGRLVAPLLASNLYTMAGPRAVWGAQLVEILAVTSLWIIFYRKLIP